MLNLIWLFLILAGVLLGGFTGRLPAVGQGAIEGAQSAVTLAIGLIGVMALWLGLMRLAERAGLIQVLARVLRPVLRRLFPDVPEGHPALGAMVMNMAANMLGLNNAATPLGLRAMRDLETLNPRPGTATNAMCTFLAINTSSVQLIPVTAVAILAANQAANPSAIIGTAFLATLVSTAVGITAVKWLEGRTWFQLAPAPRPDAPPVSTPAESGAPPESGAAAAAVPAAPEPSPLPAWGGLVLAAYGVCFAMFWAMLVRADPAGVEASRAFPRAVNAVSLLAIPFLAGLFPLYAALRRVAVYEEFVEGAKEGFQVAVRIIPYLVAMLVAIGMFRGGGGIDVLTRGLGPFLAAVGFPPDLLPLALLRPLSGSGSLALFSELVQHAGPDSLVARMGGTILGSTETTFYVIALYFGSVNVRRTRHAVPAGLLADGAGVVASVIVCRMILT